MAADGRTAASKVALLTARHLLAVITAATENGKVVNQPVGLLKEAKLEMTAKARAIATIPIAQQLPSVMP